MDTVTSCVDEVSILSLRTRCFLFTCFSERLTLSRFQQNVSRLTVGRINTSFTTTVPFNINLTRHPGLKPPEALLGFNSEDTTFVLAFLLLFDSILSKSFTRRYTRFPRKILTSPLRLSFCASTFLLPAEPSQINSTVAGEVLISSMASFSFCPFCGTSVSSYCPLYEENGTVSSSV